MPRDHLMDRILRREIEQANRHLPKNRISVSTLLNMEEPYIEARDGSKIYLSKKALSELANLLPSHILSKLNLPLIFMRKMDLGQGVYVIVGGRVEADAVKRLLRLSYHPPKTPTGEYYTFKPFVAELVKRFGSLMSIGFF